MGKLTFVGLGLNDVRDISVKGMDAVKEADSVFAEMYTSMLQGSSHTELESFLGVKVRTLSREEVESEDIIIESAGKENTVFLTAGDTLSATTHQSLRLTAIQHGITIRIVHSASVFTAIPSLLGLPSYKFGRTTTLARPEKGYFPLSPYDVIENNLKIGLHTLVLLDIKSDEQYYMTGSEGLELLSRMENEKGSGILTNGKEVAVVARAGSESPGIWYGRIENGMKMDFGTPLHSIVIPGDLHFMEAEMLDLWKTREE